MQGLWQPLPLAAEAAALVVVAVGVRVPLVRLVFKFPCSPLASSEVLRRLF